MIISRKVYDPTWILPGNKMAKTIGLYGHTPKYWKCGTYNFDSYWQMQTTDMTFELDGVPHTMKRQYELDDPWIIDSQTRAAEQRDLHSKCRKNKRHRSATGYLRWIGPKKSWTFWYQGNPFRHKLIERGASGTVIFRGKVINQRDRQIF